MTAQSTAITRFPAITDAAAILAWTPVIADGDPAEFLIENTMKSAINSVHIFLLSFPAMAPAESNCNEGQADGDIYSQTDY